MQKSLEEIEKRTLDIYTRNAIAFDQQRHKHLLERRWLERFTFHIPPGGALLDVGCGAAQPIAEYLITEGYQVVGVDFSESMLELARVRFPENEWINCDMRELDLKRAFNGVLAWNSFFHLTQDDQRNTLNALAKHVLPGGVLMLTVGPEAGEVIGHVNQEEVYHASLDPEEYRAILSTLKFDIIEFVFEDENCDFQTVLLAKKRT